MIRRRQLANIAVHKRHVALHVHHHHYTTFIHSFIHLAFTFHVFHCSPEDFQRSFCYAKGTFTLLAGTFLCVRSV